MSMIQVCLTRMWHDSLQDSLFSIIYLMRMLMLSVSCAFMDHLLLLAPLVK